MEDAAMTINANDRFCLAVNANGAGAKVYELRNGTYRLSDPTKGKAVWKPSAPTDTLASKLQRFLSDREAHEKTMAELDDLTNKLQEPTTGGASAVKQFGERVDAKVAGGMTFSEASRAVSVEEPALYEQYRNASFIDGSIPLSSEAQQTTQLASAMMARIIGEHRIVDQPDSANYQQLDTGNLRSGARENPIEAFLRLVRGVQTQPGMDAASAIESVKAKYPDLWEAYNNAIMAVTSR
jgi:hypothetical protein